MTKKETLMPDQGRVKLTKAQIDGLLGATDALGRMIADEMPPPESCDEWEYRDFPWMGREPWNLVMATIDGQFKFIAMSERRGPPGERRGQFWISPEAVIALRDLAARCGPERGH